MDFLKTSLINWAQHIEEMEFYKIGHSEKVANLAQKIATSRFFQLHQEVVWISAMLQNIGITRNDTAILKKHRQLDENDWSTINLHPERSIRKIKKISFFHFMPNKNLVEQIILCHHKWYDGQGFPHSIKKEDIPIESHIINIVDTYIAMSSPRPHRNKKSKKEIINELQNGVNSQYHPEVAIYFIHEVMPNLEQ